ncbi:hypothetical protein OAH18_00850 [bacterium]|nr:hypothetical protein [bacterium]
MADPSGGRVQRILATAGGCVWCVATILGFVGISAIFVSEVIPNTVEWPIHTAQSCVQIRQQTYVASESSGRVQVYDQTQKFLFGWSIQTGGGPMMLRTEASNVVVACRRVGVEYEFTSDGELLAKHRAKFNNEAYARLRPKVWGSLPLLFLPLARQDVARCCFFLGLFLAGCFSWKARTTNGSE